MSTGFSHRFFLAPLWTDARASACLSEHKRDTSLPAKARDSNDPGFAGPDGAKADGDATPTTGNPSPTVSPFRVTYPIGGGTTPPKPPPEELDEARALADAIDAAADDALRGEGFIGSRELTSQLLQAADASRAPCRSPFAELGDGEGLPQQ